MSSKIIKIHDADNVLVALTDLKAGETVTYQNQTIKLVNDIPAKHKFVTRDMNVQDEIIMYGVPVGKALSPIRVGAAITTQNVKHTSANYSGKTATFNWKAPDVSRWRNKTFMGYHRADGQVGTANYWIVVPLVFCENRNVDVIREAFEQELGFGKTNAYKQYVHQMVSLYREGKTDSISNISFKDET